MGTISKENKLTPRTIAYIRVSTDSQDVDKQRLEILDHAHRSGLTINEFIQVEISSRRSAKERRINELTEKLLPGDTLIISELSRLGRSIPEVIALVNELAKNQVRLIAIKQSLDLNGTHDMAAKVMVTVFSLLAELERDLVSSRTKSALAALKSRGKILGRPKGSKSKSILDGKEDEIKLLLSKKVSKASIAKILDVSRGNLIRYIRTRKISVEGC